MIHIKIKETSGFRKKIIKSVIHAFNKRKQSVSGAKAYLDEHNKHFALTLKMIKLILKENGIETKKKGVKNV